MPVPLEKLAEGVTKLQNLEGVLPGREYYTYGLGRHVARQVEGKAAPLEASEFYQAALSHRRGSHLAPSGEEMLAVAKAAFGEPFAQEVRLYMERLDRERATGRPAH